MFNVITLPWVYPLSSFLFPLSSFLLPLSTFLFPPSTFLLPLSSFLFPLYEEDAILLHKVWSFYPLNDGCLLCKVPAFTVLGIIPLTLGRHSFRLHSRCVLNTMQSYYILKGPCPFQAAWEKIFYSTFLRREHQCNNLHWYSVRLEGGVCERRDWYPSQWE